MLNEHSLTDKNSNSCLGVAHLIKEGDPVAQSGSWQEEMAYSNWVIKDNLIKGLFIQSVGKSYENQKGTMQYPRSSHGKNLPLPLPLV